MSLALMPVCAFNDNYIWVVHDGHCALVVDPGDAKPVARYLQQHALSLVAVLITHHHPDHIGGLHELMSSHGSSTTLVAGPADQRIDGLTQVVAEADKVVVDKLGLNFEVLEVPGHTCSHIAFHNQHWLFAGDTLFSAGCGRLFEGTAEQMQRSLDKIAALPGAVLLCCGHEYSAANCRFALAVDPENHALQQRCEQVSELRAKQLPTLPVSLAAEMTYNPFLRTRTPAVAAAASQRTRPQAQQQPHDAPKQLPADQVMAIIRTWKDQF